MFISLYQEYENQDHYTSELLLIFRRTPCLRPQCVIHSGLYRIKQVKQNIINYKFWQYKYL